MKAKCSQKRIRHQPDYNFGYEHSPDFLDFKYNKYFPQLLKDYKDTKFFKEAYNTCSYLKDFLNRK